MNFLKPQHWESEIPTQQIKDDISNCKKFVNCLFLITVFRQYSLPCQSTEYVAKISEYPLTADLQASTVSFMDF